MIRFWAHGKGYMQKKPKQFLILNKEKNVHTVAALMWICKEIVANIILKDEIHTFKKYDLWWWIKIIQYLD